MSDHNLSLDIILHDDKGRRTSTSQRAETMAKAVLEISRFLQQTIDGEGRNIHHVSITIGRRHD